MHVRQLSLLESKAKHSWMQGRKFQCRNTNSTKMMYLGLRCNYPFFLTLLDLFTTHKYPHSFIFWGFSKVSVLIWHQSIAERLGQKCISIILWRNSCSSRAICFFCKYLWKPSNTGVSLHFVSLERISYT